METIRLRYGNTSTFLVGGRLLVDTDYAGTLPALYRALKAAGVRMERITHVLATHWHPDHCGLIGELQRQDVRLILPECQRGFVHASDPIFDRDRLRYVPADVDRAEIVPVAESRAYLRAIGIAGEILATPSHSADSVSLMLDSGDCIVGDLQPRALAGGYEDNAALLRDWDRIMRCRPKRILYAHWPEERVSE